MVVHQTTDGGSSFVFNDVISSPAFKFFLPRRVRFSLRQDLNLFITLNLTFTRATVGKLRCSSLLHGNCQLIAASGATGGDQSNVGPVFGLVGQSNARLLQEMGKSFHMLSPRQPILDLIHYSCLKDRLPEVYEGVFQADPEGFGQLWRDRRDPQKFWTFWVAMAILVLTIVSTTTTVIQTWAALRAIDISNRPLERY